MNNTLIGWIEAVEQKLREQEQKIQQLEVRMKELEAQVRTLEAEVHRHKQRVAVLERILLEKGLLPPEFSLYGRWMNTLH